MSLKNESEAFKISEKPIPGISIIASGKITHDSFNFEGFRVLHDYAAVYISRGHGEFYESPGSTPRPLTEGDLFFLTPRVPHRYGPIKGSWTQYWIVFNGIIAGLLEKEYIDPHNPVLSGIRSWDVQSAFEEIISLSKRRTQGYRIQTSVILYRMLLSVIPGIAGAEKPLDSKELLIREIKERLKENLFTRRTIQDVLTIRGYSYNYLRTLFKERSGFSPIQYRNRQRIEYVCEQLSFSSQSIKEIAYNAGFDDPQYFSRVFRKTTGISPGQYRRSIISYTRDQASSSHCRMNHESMADEGFPDYD